MNIYRVLRTLSAHGYGQIITVITTLAIPTVAVAKWGVEGFGYWVTLTALAQFFMMADWGASTALANQLCLKSSRTAEDAWSLTRSVIFYFMKKGLIAAVMILLISLIVGGYYWREVGTEQAFLLAITFAALALTAALQPAQAIYSAAWRFIGRNEVGIFIFNTSRLLDFGVIVGIALANGSMYMAAAAVAVVKLITVLVLYYHAPTLIMNGENVPGNNQNDKKHIELVAIKQAGQGFTLIALSQQLTLHGPVLMISVILGPVQAAVFAACRTLSRLPVQPLSVLLASLNPELTELIAKKQYQQLKLIVRRVALAIIAVSVVIGVGSVWYVDVVERIWLAGKLDLDLKVLIPLCFAASFYLGGQVINQALTAANQTREQSRQFMAVSILMIAFMLPLLVITNQTMWGAILVLAAESLMMMLLLRRYRAAVV